MFHAARKHIRAIATIGIASALVAGGVAGAQSNSQSGSQGPGGHPAGPPPLGPPMKGLTYAEFHVQKNGEAQVIRLDQGKIASVDETSITLTENDGSSVTIPLDEDTKVLAKPGEDSTVDDLSVGQLVVVCAPEGGAAKSIMAVPKQGQVKGGPQGGQLPPPPDGSHGPQGGGNS
jgi:hypothetical protein